MKFKHGIVLGNFYGKENSPLFKDNFVLDTYPDCVLFYMICFFCQYDFRRLNKKFKHLSDPIPMISISIELNHLAKFIEKATGRRSVYYSYFSVTRITLSRKDQYLYKFRSGYTSFLFKYDMSRKLLTVDGNLYDNISVKL